MAAVVTLTPLRREHFPMLGRWLAEPLVARWWNHDPSPAAVERDFGPALDGLEPTELFLGSTADVPFGLVQRYAVHSYPEYVAEIAAVCQLPDGALSVDYLIGEPWARGRGLGAAMIARCVAEGWARYPDASDVLVPVALGNPASWRALERAGFSRYATGEMEPDNPIDPRDHVVYRVRRPAAERPT